MTTPSHAQRAARDIVGGRRVAVERAELPSSAPALPDRLAAARERKGVDLNRAERDTKIRSRYLLALERGNYRDLPGAVYTKGFLRNYAIYLGLDPEDVLRQWRRERGEQASPAPLVVPPRPITAPSRPLTFSPSIVVAALMTFGVLAFGAYLAVQLLRYAKPPTLAVTNPSQAVLEVDDSTDSFRLEGVSTAGATITISAPGRAQPYRVSALTDGSWTAQVDLRRGNNQFDISATNPDTGKVTDTPRTVLIRVPFLVIAAPTLNVSQPVEGTTYENGAIPVEGSAVSADALTVNSTYLGPVGSTTPAPTPSQTSPSFTPGSTPGLGAAHAGTVVTVHDDGSFSAPLELTQGRWSITITATTAGKSASVTRTVSVAYKGVTLVISIKGTSAWMKVWVDGVVAPSVGPTGRTYAAGKTVTFTGTNSIEVRTGSAGSTDFTLNGVSLGTLGKTGIPETWLFAPPSAPQRTART